MTYTDEEVLGTTVQLLAELSTRNNENLRLKRINADLLAALRKCLSYIEVTMEGENLKIYPTEREAIKEARAAIAKATGE